MNWALFSYKDQLVADSLNILLESLSDFTILVEALS